MEYGTVAFLSTCALANRRLCLSHAGRDEGSSGPNIATDRFQHLAQSHADERRHGRRNVHAQSRRRVRTECPIEEGEARGSACEARRQGCSPPSLMLSPTERASREQEGEDEAVHHADNGTGCEPEKSTQQDTGGCGDEDKRSERCGYGEDEAESRSEAQAGKGTCTCPIRHDCAPTGVQGGQAVCRWLPQVVTTVCTSHGRSARNASPFLSPALALFSRL